MKSAIGHWFGWGLGAAFWIGLPVPTGAMQRFPPPQFETDHALPVTTTPPPDGPWRDVLDVAVLAGALGLAAWLVLVRRSRRGVLALVVFSLIYFGFWRGGCVCPIGAIQNVTAALADPGHALPLVVAAFFLLPLLATIMFGRVYCAGVCPLGAIQDVVVIKPLRVPMWLEHALGMLAYVYLGAAVLFAATGSAWIICEYDPFVGLFRMSGTTFMLGLGAVFLLAGMFFARPYCRWLCPYGVLMSWIAPGAVWQPRIDPVGCIQCQLCRDGCPINAIDVPDVPSPAGSGGTGGPMLPGPEAGLRAGPGVGPGVGPGAHRRDRRRMAVLLIAAPMVISIGALLGHGLTPALTRMNERVRLADRLLAEDMGWVEGHTDATAAFRSRGDSRTELATETKRITSIYAWGGPLLGGFIGLVLAAKLIQQARRRRSDEFVIHQPRCVACARCLALCPHHPGNEARLVELTREKEPL
ncbi:MAG: 4Fe-4S binding protein [Phycisphaeraceae bacterium]|nr:4Fe-4S binding protein [Phycisphaeraceae bacterium]